MLSESSEKSEKVPNRIQELSEQRVELMRATELAALRDPDSYVTALVELQRCERRLGLLLAFESQAQDMKVINQKGTENDCSGGGMSITIFFLPGADFQSVLPRIERIIDWKWLRGSIYAFEQKGTDELTLGHNAHVHIFAPNQYEKQRAIKQLSTCLKDVIYSPSSVHVLMKPSTWLGTCQSYLTGKKSGVEESVYRYDRLWRDRQRLPHPETTAAEFEVSRS